MSADLEGAFSKIHAALGEALVAVDGVDPQRCGWALGELRRYANQIEALTRSVTHVVDGTLLYADDGYRNAAAWIAFQTGERPSVCARRVRHCRQLVAMPAARAAAAAGCLTPDHLQLLCDAREAASDRYDSEVDERFAALAMSATFSELRRQVGEWRVRDMPDPPEDIGKPGAMQPEVRLHLQSDGWWNGTFRLAPADGLMLNALIDAEVDRYLRAVRDGDPSLTGQPMTSLRAHALLDVVTRSARRLPEEMSAPDRYRVVVVVSPDADVPPEALCDADFYRLVLGAHSEPLDTGRATKRWSPAQRRAVTYRDGYCTFPGCDRPPSHCDIHHCRRWADGGDTAIVNGTLLCRHHHTFIHKRRWQVHLDHRQRPRFTRPDGTSHPPISHRPSLCSTGAAA